MEIREYDNLKGKLITIADDIHLPISTNLHAISLEGKVQNFDFVVIEKAFEEATIVEDEGEGEKEVEE